MFAWIVSRSEAGQRKGVRHRSHRRVLVRRRRQGVHDVLVVYDQSLVSPGRESNEGRLVTLERRLAAEARGQALWPSVDRCVRGLVAGAGLRTDGRRAVKEPRSRRAGASVPGKTTDHPDAGAGQPRRSRSGQKSSRLAVAQSF